MMVLCPILYPEEMFIIGAVLSTKMLFMASCNFLSYYRYSDRLLASSSDTGSKHTQFVHVGLSAQFFVRQGEAMQIMAIWTGQVV